MWPIKEIENDTTTHIVANQAVIGCRYGSPININPSA